MCVLVWSEEDRVMAENAILDCVSNLRAYPKVRVDYRNRWRRTIINEMMFLRDFFPDSEVLKEDFSDISLEIERTLKLCA